MARLLIIILFVFFFFLKDNIENKIFTFGKFHIFGMTKDNPKILKKKKAIIYFGMEGNPLIKFEGFIRLIKVEEIM